MDELKNLDASGNIKASEKEGYAICSVDTKIYPLEVIYSAAYMMMDKAYILLAGDPESKITIEIRPKGKDSLKEIAYEFNEELINYAVYKQQSEKNRAMREAILQRVLLTNNPQEGAPMGPEKEEPIADPEGIMRLHKKDEKEC
jgi:His-Xaa-Ser system protein HxsD